MRVIFKCCVHLPDDYGLRYDELLDYRKGRSEYLKRLILNALETVCEPDPQIGVLPANETTQVKVEVLSHSERQVDPVR